MGEGLPAMYQRDKFRKLSLEHTRTQNKTKNEQHNPNKNELPILRVSSQKKKLLKG